MTLQLQPFDAEDREAPRVAELIFEADQELNELALGRRSRAVDAILKMMRMDGADNFYAPHHVWRVVSEEQLVGVVVGFYGHKRRRVETATGHDFLRAFGLWKSLKRLPTWFQLGRLIIKELSDDAYYILNLTVDASRQNEGIGTQILDELTKRHGKLYLEVNVNNHAARRFYERNGFTAVTETHVKIDGRQRGTFTMCRPADASTTTQNRRNEN